MSPQEENEIRITAYLEDKMTPSEEEAFMQELGVNEILRQQYEDELLMSGLLKNTDSEQMHGKDFLFQPADEHIKMVETALEKTTHQQKSFRLINIFTGYRIAAAAAVVIILATILFFLFNTNNSSGVETVTKTGPSKDIKENDSLISKKQMPAPAKKNPMEGTVDADSLKTNRLSVSEKDLVENVYKEFYSPYQNNEKDPVEVRPYYKSYSDGNYKHVLSATDADIQQMGSSERDLLLKQYLQLYKGLSSLAENQTKLAIQYFDSILRSSSEKSNQYYQAQWYLALAYLKNNNMPKTLELEKEISQSQSVYNVKARELLKKLTKE